MTPVEWFVRRSSTGVWLAWWWVSGITYELIPCDSWRTAYDLADTSARS